MQYQSFPGVKGSSESANKLAALRLPSLAGKRYLDVGCNEGYFAGYGLFDGADRVVGIDKSATAIKKAKSRFPQGDFRQQSWEVLPEGPFDVITLLSALHYAEDQEALIHRLMAQLADDGVLVLEISMARGVRDEWVKVRRAIDERYFPTRHKLGKVLDGYAWKVIGHSVNQPGDPLQRYVVHVRKLKPYAYLMLEKPGSGKSTLARKLFRKAKVPVVGGDGIYQQVSQGKYDVSSALRAVITEEFSTSTIDKTTHRAFEEGLAGELVELWTSRVGYVDFALDTYVPPAYHEAVRSALISRGYFPVAMHWEPGARPRRKEEAVSRTHDYQKFLSRTAPPANRIVVHKLMKGGDESGFHWSLDSPVHGQLAGDEDSVTLAGWVILDSKASVVREIYCQAGDDLQLHAFNIPRQDALHHVFGDQASLPLPWDTEPCGFRFEVNVSCLQKALELGVWIDEKRIPLAYLTVDSSRDGKLGRLGYRLRRTLKNPWGGERR